MELRFVIPPAFSLAVLLAGGCALVNSEPVEVAPVDATTAKAPAPKHPNILIIMTDDQGYGDLSVHGNPVLETPRIDQLAGESTSFERFYVSPVCTPTRAALMTGRNSIRTRAIDTYRGRAMMDPREVTLAEALGGAGYRTGLFGKWHLGDNAPMRPQDQGFDEVLMHRAGGLAQPADALSNNRRYTNAVLFHNGDEVQTEGYCMDVYTDAAIDFMQGSVAQGEPFFAYVATNTPHGPWHDTPQDLYEKYKSRDLSLVCDNEKNFDRLARTYAMVENIDQNVGRMLDALAESGVAEHTIVVYLHDNGPATNSYVGEMRGTKSTILEGGIRSPFFMRWPDKLAAGVTRKEIASHVDVWPTLLEAAGVEAQPYDELDGKSLWPLMTGAAGRWNARLVHIQAHRGDQRHVEHNFAVIGPRYKLLRSSGFGREEYPKDPAPLKLYDIIADPWESQDLASAYPQIVAEYLSAHRAWYADAASSPGFGTPPRIEIGHPDEPVTTLNRNDWRNAEAGGYGKAGTWWLHSARARVVDIELQFRSEVLNGKLGTVILDFAGRTFTADVEGPVQSLRFTELDIPSGDFNMHVRIESIDGLVAVEHVVVTPVR